MSQKPTEPLIHLLTVALLACISFSNVWGDGPFDVISNLPSPAQNVEIERIDRPNVKEPVTGYRTITYKPGDFITIFAGGCVQTGGHGKTWKRYVDPQGSNSDRLYHGIINIVGITKGPTRIMNYGLCTEKQVSDNAPAGECFLQLGYEDDGFGDNGYYARNDDNGTGDQCKGLPDAFVIIAIRHGGDPLPNMCQAMQNAISSGNFRSTAAWSFHNFDTSSIGNTFTDAFDLGYKDYFNPITWILKAAGKGMAKTGNCEGMSLLADCGQKEWVMDDGITESFWNLKQTSEITHDINVSHWRQLSVYFLEHWLHSVFDSPTTTASRIESDLQSNHFGLLSMEHGWGGHVVVPLSVQRTSGKILVQVYNPNIPSSGPTDTGADNPPVTIEGDHWSFPMGADTWTQADAELGCGMGYIPYQIDRDWTNLANNLDDAVTIVFGAGTSVDQMTDSSGRQLFRKGAVFSQTADFSAKGLAHDVVKMTFFDEAGTSSDSSSPPKIPMHASKPETPDLAKIRQQVEAKYGTSYQDTREIYFVMNHKLSDLSIQITTRKPGEAVNFLVGDATQFLEARTAPAEKNQSIQPTLLIHSFSNLSAGVRLSDRRNVIHNTTFGFGQIDVRARQLHVEEATDVKAGAVPVEWGAAADRTLEIRSVGNSGTFGVNSYTLDGKGVAQRFAPKTVSMKLLK